MTIPAFFIGFDPTLISPEGQAVLCQIRTVFFLKSEEEQQKDNGDKDDFPGFACVETQK
ncbi:MAG: hypothetical protein P4N41_17135 [Negativicutes bacterium]|nr:hypothetical protein [Negativicutes bacterium]